MDNKKLTSYQQLELIADSLCGELSLLIEEKDNNCYSKADVAYYDLVLAVVNSICERIEKRIGVRLLDIADRYREGKKMIDETMGHSIDDCLEEII